MNLLLSVLASQSIVLQIVFILCGMGLVLAAADWLTKGAVAVAERLKVPQVVIGMTIVAIGTSMPEFFVSLCSAVKGTADLAVGNIVGSNIFNSLAIVGCAAAVAPIAILPQTVRRDIPFALVASVLLLILCLDSVISRLDAAILFALFLVFIVFTLREARAGKTEEKTSKPMSVGGSLLLIVGGLVGLIGGSELFVDNASALASSLGVSDAVIGLTIVACGTSLPELATSVVAAKKGNSGIAIGNVLGSNVFNILMILGITGLITPMQMSGITTVDFSMLVISMILLWLFSYTKLRIERWEGLFLVGVFIGYMTYLVMNA